MRARALRCAVLAALALPAPPQAAAQRGDRADTVVAVPADGTTATTTFVTSRGARYRLTVSGAYAYDRFGGLADCGYRDVDAAVVGQSWQPSPGLLVDGAAAACGAYGGTHTYVLHVTGTGARFAFALAADPTGHADNTGALTVAVETLVDVDAECRWTATPVPGGTYVVLYALAAEAHQSGTGAAGTVTSVWCRAYTEQGELVMEAAAAAQAPAVAAADETGTFLAQPQRLTTCLEATVWDSSGTLLHRTYPCS